MTFCEELYFEITITGAKSEIKKFVSFLRSGELDEFFEIDPDYINLDDEYPVLEDEDDTTVIFSNDDYGIEIDEFDSDEFLDVFCRAAKELDVRGRLFDVDDEEYCFASAKGESYYLNTQKISIFNDELDAQALAEEEAASEDDE